MKINLRKTGMKL